VRVDGLSQVVRAHRVDDADRLADTQLGQLLRSRPTTVAGRTVPATA
jgi:hypothetical protein